jgi:FkbM family methyltransferase
MYNISQTCQIVDLNQIYQSHFGYPSKGTFVEVGAYDGETFSNTSCLADIGWKGIYIEPVESSFKKCIERHKNNDVKVIQCLVGSEEIDKTLYVGNQDKISWGGAITTSNETHLEIYKTKSPNFSEINFSETVVRQIRLDTLLNKNNIDPNFDLLVVDVEGSEFDVYDSFDLGYWKPKMMIVEIEEKHQCFNGNENYLNNCAKMRKDFNGLGYSEIWNDPTNTVFLLDELK